MMKLLNPFVIGRYESVDYFCDRVVETALLKKHVVNGRHVTLISPRRLGKTGLIEHFFSQEDVQQEYYTFFVDIYATASLAEFVALLGKEIFEKLKSQTTQWSERFFKIVTSLRPALKVNPRSGDFSFEIGLGEISSPQTSLDEIFSYLEQADKHCIVAIDEFQQISSYDEKNVEALLRTKIQHCRNITFIYTGSKRHMVSQMFNSAANPFYNSAIGMSLNPIPCEIYCQFASDMFEKYDKHLDVKVVEEIYHRYKGYTWYMQMMLNELFALTEKGATCDSTLIPQAYKNIIIMQKDFYMEMMSKLGTKQKMLLVAIARECFFAGGKARALTSGAFIKKYQLPSASSVQSALKGLIEKDIVTSFDGEYHIQDLFFSEWLVGY